MKLFEFKCFTNIFFLLLVKFHYKFQQKNMILLSYEKSVFYKTLHEVLVNTAPSFKDIRDMNDEILVQPCLEDSKDIEKNLSRTSTNTILAIYLQTYSIMKQKHDVEPSAQQMPHERQALVEKFVKDAVIAFNYRAIEELCNN